MFSVCDKFMFVNLRSSATDNLYHARHTDVAVADVSAAPAADACHRQFALNKVMGKFTEEAAVAAVVYRLTRVMTAGHARETAKRASIPDTDTLDFVRPYPAVAHREAGAGRADISAAAAFEAAVADLLPCFFKDFTQGDITYRCREPTRGAFKTLSNIIQNSATLFYVGFNALPENRIGEHRLAGRCPGNSHKIVSKIHELQIEMVARSRAGIGTYAETLIVDVLIQVSADYINKKQIRATLLIVNVTEFTAQIETVEMRYPCHIARAYSEDRKLW